MSKKFLAAMFVSALTLTGCASGNTSAETGESTSLYERRITLNDGRTLTCVTYSGYQKGGLSCDWDGAR